MKSAALTNGSGPGSSISLSPTSIRVRDAIIEKFIDKSLDELNSFLASALDTEREEAKRIGILAARVYILRMRISKIIEFNQNSMIPAIEPVSPPELISAPQHFDEPIIDAEAAAKSADKFEEWNELMTIEDGEINGVRIPRGVAITVGKEDAARLIETGKAELISEDGATGVSVSEYNASPDEPAITVEDDVTEADAVMSEDTQNDQSGEIPADPNEETPEFSVEDTGMSSPENTADDHALGAQEALSAEDAQASDDVQEALSAEDAQASDDVQEALSAEDAQASDDVNDEAEKDETNPQT